MDIVEESVDLGLRRLFDDISIEEKVDNDVEFEEESESEWRDEEDEEAKEDDEYLDGAFSSYDFVNNEGEVETFWTIDAETCTILFDLDKATRIRDELAEKRKDRVVRKMDDKEIIPSRDEVRKQEFFPKYEDTEFVQELSR